MRPERRYTWGPMRRLALLLPLLSACATARLAQERAPFPPDPGAPRTVVIEPLFELADWQTTTKTEYAELTGLSPGYGYSGMYGYRPGYGGFGSPSTVAVTSQVQEKPLFARPPVLTAVHAQVLAEVQKRRPSWRVTSTAGAPVLAGQVTVVRTIIQGNQTVTSDRVLKNLALGFGFVIWPLELVHIDPVHETERVDGILERFALSADLLKTRLVKYPTQPDYAVNLSSVDPLRRRFALEVAYTEGILANEAPRRGVLITGFVDRLASAIVALVEEAASPAPPPPPPPVATPVSPTRLREDAP
jgi:hypothetical protein